MTFFISVVLLRVQDIRDVEWNNEAFKNLETDAETKTLIQAVVQHKLESDKSIDFIKGKGTGLIILLHGFVHCQPQQTQDYMS